MEKKYLNEARKYEEEVKNVDELRKTMGNYYKEITSLNVQIDDEMSARVKVEKELKNLKASTTSKQVTFGDDEVRHIRRSHEPPATVSRRVGDKNDIGMPILSPYDLLTSKTANQLRRSSIQMTSQGRSYLTRTRAQK